MKLFLSWSGPRSRFIAVTLRWWLPNVIQAVEPFISAQDIEKGTRGLNTISKHLEESSIGIICLTPENQDKAWILFEAGALSKQATAHVCTLIYDLAWTDVKQPLASFQHTSWSEEELNSLCRTINAQLPADRRLVDDRLQDAFRTWYPKLVERMEGIPEKTPDEPPVEARSEESKLDEILTMLRRQKEIKPQIMTFLDASSGPTVEYSDMVRPMTAMKASTHRINQAQLEYLLGQIRIAGGELRCSKIDSTLLGLAIKSDRVKVCHDGNESVIMEVEQ